MLDKPQQDFDDLLHVVCSLYLQLKPQLDCDTKAALIRLTKERWPMMTMVLEGKI